MKKDLLKGREAGAKEVHKTGLFWQAACSKGLFRRNEGGIRSGLLEECEDTDIQCSQFFLFQHLNTKLARMETILPIQLVLT